MGTVVPLRKLYEAKQFSADTSYGAISASGTLCGHIDFVGPWEGSYPLSVAEADEIIGILQRAKTDVLENSGPLHDPRII